jgi:hypothetical protein
MVKASQLAEVHKPVRSKPPQQLLPRHQQDHHTTAPLDSSALPASSNAADLSLRPALLAKKSPVRHVSLVSSLAKSSSLHPDKQLALPRPPAVRMAKDRPLAANSASVSLRGRLTASRAAVEAKVRSGRSTRSGRQFTVGSISHGLIYLRCVSFPAENHLFLLYCCIPPLTPNCNLLLTSAGPSFARAPT